MSHTTCSSLNCLVHSFSLVEISNRSALSNVYQHLCIQCCSSMEHHIQHKTGKWSSRFPHIDYNFILTDNADILRQYRKRYQVLSIVYSLPKLEINMHFPYIEYRQAKVQSCACPVWHSIPILARMRHYEQKTVLPRARPTASEFATRKRRLRVCAFNATKKIGPDLATVAVHWSVTVSATQGIVARLRDSCSVRHQKKASCNNQKEKAPTVGRTTFQRPCKRSSALENYGQC